ncbi:MBL fold metallo-hydrolase [Salinisphaera orenii]|uniref:Beta-lactamase n=1 Tax=Salinisphaera orenii YIM 95161 TaxID=1051139 RepID=A0A423PTZ0_9GAMM|nr:MBL fold metallo-hydrolase [Salinisphaera halophila]ROO28992.1 beta-lactamase [Salinisphaera halophila YIM 95161]
MKTFRVPALRRAGFVVLLCLSLPVAAQTQVVMLGTGTPVPDGDRAGQSFAVVHDGEAYVFDLGGGAVQNAIRASEEKDIKALYPTNIDHVFFTHLHSDHMLDYPEMLGTYWWRRDAHINVYGPPPGTQQMSDGVYEMMAPDLKARFAGNQPIKDKEGYKANVTEITKDGTVFEDDGIRIDAFSVPHGSLAHAFGYKIVTDDRTIVISGDTAYSPVVAEQAKGADILIHEAISQEGLSALPEFWQNYHHDAHTVSTELAKIANQAKPGKLVIVHNLFYGADEDSTLEEVRAAYDGDVVLADDLDVY